jgi:hypothetical protein
MWPRPLYAKEVDVCSLRRGAEDGDWSRCLHSTTQLLLRLPGQRALELVRQEVAARLPVFERHAPMPWVRQAVRTSIRGPGMIHFRRPVPVPSSPPWNTSGRRTESRMST